jgi:ribosome-associated protein
MNDGLALRGSMVIPESELQWRFSRSSGPGGQSVNTTDSRVELVFDITSTRALPEPLRARAVERLADRLDTEGCIVVVASEYRSQWQNRRAARGRMADLLRAAIAPPPRPRRPTRPTRTSVEDRLRTKRARAQVKRLRSGRSDD